MCLKSLKSVRDPTPGLHICLRSWLTDSPSVLHLYPGLNLLTGACPVICDGMHVMTNISSVYILQNCQCDGKKHNFVSRWCQMIVLILGWYTCWTTLLFMSLLKTDVFIIRKILFWMRKLKYDCLSWEHISNGYVNPWDLLNNFCFYVFTLKLLFVMLSVVTCHMWNA